MEKNAYNIIRIFRKEVKAMKDVRPEFTPEEYERLVNDADRLSISVKQLVHDRAVGITPKTTLMVSAKTLSDEISKYREVLNEIIRRETTAEIRLYEDDVIRLEASMNALEGVVSAFITEAMKRKVK